MPPKKTAKAPSPAPKARALSGSRASLARAGAAVLGVPKAAAAPRASSPSSPAAPAAAAIAFPKEAAAPPPLEVAAEAPATSGPIYSGQPLELKAAEALLKAVAAEDMKVLAGKASEEEQLPARMMLEFVGDKDLSWKNAQGSLQEGSKFVKEILEMNGASFVTRKSLERMDAIGKLQPLTLKDSNPAAFAMAVYLEAVIDAAQEKLGMKVQPVKELPPPAEEPPAWPIKIPFKDINQSLSDAIKFRRTPLFVCNGKAATVDTFFSYQACCLIDAKWILHKVNIAKELDAPAVREELRSRLVAALKFGQPIWVAMSNSAVTLKEKYCSDSEFPEALFKMDLWFQRETYSKVVREEDLKDWPGAFPGRMRDDDASYCFVTTDFTMESAREFLPPVLPHFDSMAIIEIDPASID